MHVDARPRFQCGGTTDAFEVVPREVIRHAAIDAWSAQRRHMIAENQMSMADYMPQAYQNNEVRHSPSQQHAQIVVLAVQSF
jgi:ribosome maturation protein Sdo1